MIGSEVPGKLSVRARIECLVLFLVGSGVMGALVTGCAMAAPSDFGVTSGGQQDIAAARQVINGGDIPDPDWITVEGFLSEHSIPVPVPDNAGELYVTAQTSWNADFDAFTPLVTVMVGFGTTIDRDSFQRESLNLGIVIDRSGSMGDLINTRTGTSKLDAVKIAIDRLLSKLTADDRVTVVSFNNGSTLDVADVQGNDIAAVKTAIDGLVPGGGTNLESGMRRAYRAVQERRSVGRSDRLIVFTDAELTVWPVQQRRALLDLMDVYSDLEVGATIFGVGSDIGQDLAYEISQVRGGNYFFLSDYERIVTVFDEEFDFLVTPVAYDVELEVDVPFAFDVADVYGIPVEPPFPHTVPLRVPTLFLSNRAGGGAIFVRVRAGAAVDLAEVTDVAGIGLRYKARGGQVVSAPGATARLPGGLTQADPYFDSDASRRGVLLLNTALVLRNACADLMESCFNDWWGTYCYPDSSGIQRAGSRLDEFLPYFDGLAAGLIDRPSETSRSLSAERDLIVRLRANVAALR
jgi:Ca-activated chloride channel family protein